MYSDYSSVQHSEIGELHYQQGNLNEAYKNFFLAIQVARQNDESINPKYYYDCARVLNEKSDKYHEGFLWDALEWINEALKIEPNFPNGQELKNELEKKQTRFHINEDMSVVSYEFEGAKLNGLVVCKKENGDVLYEEMYADNELNGLCRYYEESEIATKGELFLQAEHTYKFGRKHGPQKDYHSNGQLKAKYLCKDDEWHGNMLLYYPSGQLQVDLNYIDGRETGVATSYFESGMLRRTTTMKDGSRHGLRTMYNEDGTIESKVLFQDGCISEIIIGAQIDKVKVVFDRLGVTSPLLEFCASWRLDVESLMKCDMQQLGPKHRCIDLFDCWWVEEEDSPSENYLKLEINSTWNDDSDMRPMLEFLSNIYGEEILGVFREEREYKDDFSCPECEDADEDELIKACDLCSGDWHIDNDGTYIHFMVCNHDDNSEIKDAVFFASNDFEWGEEEELKYKMLKGRQLDYWLSNVGHYDYFIEDYGAEMEREHFFFVKKKEFSESGWQQILESRNVYELERLSF